MMKDVFQEYRRKKDYLVCIDSDGCVMDSMDIKHKQCFGPQMINVWNLQAVQEDILNRWNEINLYSVTRGINRFKSLALALSEINSRGITIEGVDQILRWVNESKELSNEAIKMQVGSNHPIFAKALEWSERVNIEIEKLPNNPPFENAKECLVKLHEFADIAIVSSANEAAIKKEWTIFGLIGYTDILLAQTAGSKADCIRTLKQFNYDGNKVLMIGDAMGDYEAAYSNEVQFYPIVAGQEKESWSRMLSNMADYFQAGEYRDGYQDQEIQNWKKKLTRNKGIK